MAFWILVIYFVFSTCYGVGYCASKSAPIPAILTLGVYAYLLSLLWTLK
jgi:hypothetical protein